MKCDRCQSQIVAGDEREHAGQTLCEDCYIDALSTVKACDPWAVHSAKSMSGDGAILTKRQNEILTVLKATDGIEPAALAEKLGLDLPALEREMATLRHMEKIRAAKRGGRKVFCLW
jgi:predicted transcriptional regulator